MSTDRTHLLIPIHVDALVVTEYKPRFLQANAAPRYAGMSIDYRTGTELRVPDAVAKLELGVHLHFRLPVALAHSSSGGNFPRIPNRWVVQRWYRTTSGALSIRAWLIRADKEAAAGGTAVVLPVFPASAPDREYDTPLILRPTGMAERIAETGTYKDEDDVPAETELTAVTGGDAGFSAHYPACRSILGFHDDMSDLPGEAQLSYLVTGWYSGKVDDPWSQLVSGQAGKSPADAKLAVDQWLAEHRCGKTFAASQPLPSGILCHGRVQDVAWNKKGPPANINPDPFRDFDIPREYWVDIGNTSAEAFAARVAVLRNQDSRDLQEDLVNAFQSGLLSEGTDFSALDTELHRLSFAPAAGESVWLLEAAPQAPGGDDSSRAPLPAPVRDKLDELNRRERELDRRERLLRDYRWELYAVWYRHMDADRNRKAKDKAALAESLEALKPFVVAYAGKVSEAERARDNAIADLRQALAGYSGGAKYTIASRAGSPFYVPRDPVLLVSGPAMQALGTVSKPAGMLPCRVTSEELRSFTCDEKNGQAGIVVEGESLLKARGISASFLATIPAWCARLLQEVLLQDEMATRIASGLYNEGTVKPKAGIMPDDFGAFAWKHNPWIPVYVHWEITWKDEVADQVMPDKWTPDKWTLDTVTVTVAREAAKFGRNTDLQPIASSTPPAPGKPLSMRGFSFPGTPLSSLQSSRFQGKAKELLNQIDARLHNRMSVMMSLALAGFHDALIGRRAGDQLPPLDFDRWKKQTPHRFYLDRIRTVLGAAFHPDSSPVSGAPFSPVRTGSLEVKGLRVIDAFGQLFDVPVNKLTAAGFAQSSRLGLSSVPAPVPPPPPSWRLRPRFCRPMRLGFRGVPAGLPIPGAPSATPVCGWIVLNHFDQNLVLYAANGRPAGILQKRYKSNIAASLFYWVSIPGSNGIEATVAGIANEHLRDFASFVLSLDADEGTALAELLNESVESTSQRLPEDNPAVSVLIGRPLALVRAAIGFETDGLPAFDPDKSWTSPPMTPVLDEILVEDATPWPNQFMVTGNVEKASCPIRLGDRRAGNDGLIGFFRGAPGTRPFYASRGFGFRDIGNAKLRSGQDLLLDCTQPLPLTLLMDPQARVHATSGVLPRVFFELQPDELAAATQVREVFFQTAPVLGTPELPHVPRPSDDYGQWSWTYRPGVTLWKEEPDLDSASDRAGPVIGWPTLTEGWLKLKIEPVRVAALWMKSPAQTPKKNTTVTIAWSVQGADTVELFRVRSTGADSTMEFVRRWGAPPHAKEWQETIARETTFELRASDKTGYKDTRQITIRVED